MTSGEYIIYCWDIVKDEYSVEMKHKNGFYTSVFFGTEAECKTELKRLIG